MDNNSGPRKVLIALPDAMRKKIDQIAEEEHRTRSDLIREALRRYIYNFDKAKVLPMTPQQVPQYEPQY